EMTEFLRGIGAPGRSGQRLITLLGTSVAMGDFLTRHPERLSALRTGDDQLTMTAHEVRATLLRAVGADPAARPRWPGTADGRPGTTCASPITNGCSRSPRPT